MRTAFGKTQTIKVSDLRQGDFIEVIPTQRGIRGVRLESGVKTVEQPDELVWRQRGSRRGERVTSVVVTTLRGHRLDVPVDLDVVVRRPIEI